MASRFDIVYFPLGAAAYGGAERSLLELASAQQQAGKKVLVCHEPALATTDFVAHARAQGLALRAVDWSPEAGPLSVLKAAGAVFRQLDAAIIHFNISWRPRMWLVPVVARITTAARLVGTMRAMPEPLAALKPRRYLGLFDGPPLRHVADLVVGRVWARALHQTVSVNREDYPPRLVKEYAFREHDLSVIYNGVRVPEHPPDATAKATAKRALGYTDDDLLVAYVGRVSPEKGLRYMIDALPACHPRVKLVIAGDGDEMESIAKRAADAGVADRVRMLGFVNQPFDVFTAADVAVVPSLWNEAFGRVVVEAMACRAAVVATAVGGMRELFEDGVQGLFVPKESAAALAAAMNRIEASPDFLSALQHRGRELAETRYSTTRVAREYGALYSRLMVA